MERSYIKNKTGTMIAMVDTDNNGNKVLMDSHGMMLGRYDAQRDAVTDRYGMTVYYGDALALLLRD